MRQSDFGCEGQKPNINKPKAEKESVFESPLLRAGVGLVSVFCSAFLSGFILQLFVQAAGKEGCGHSS